MSSPSSKEKNASRDGDGHLSSAGMAKDRTVSANNDIPNLHSGIEAIGALSNEAVFVFDLKAKSFIYLNENFGNLFKLSTKALMKDANLLNKFIRSEDSTYIDHRVLELMSFKTITNSEFRVINTEAGITHLACTAYYFKESNSIGGVVRNVTWEKEHEDFIIDYGAKKDTLLDMMTHNLSGPLVLSQNILRWMQKNYKDRVPGEISSQLRMIEENTQECLHIIDDFLKEEHQVSGRIFVKKTRFDVIDRIKATLEKIIATNKSKKFRLITKLNDLNITTDSVKFFQIIHNLVSNSIKFTPDNGQIDIIVEESENHFTFRVRDDGIGIPLKLQEDLFTKRINGRNGLNNESSNGIGLSIVKMLVDVLEGRVYFESEENKGATFSVELPKE